MKDLIEFRRGKKKGHVGISIIIRDQNKTKSMTVHGFNINELYDMIWFYLKNMCWEESEKKWQKQEN